MLLSLLTVCLVEHPKVSLHGGPVGWDQAEWIPLTTGDLELFSSQEKEQIDKIVSDSVTTFYHISPSGDQGFPGQVRTEVLFALLPALAAKGGPITTDKEIVLGSLAIIYRAKLLGSEKVVTPINLTQVEKVQFCVLLCLITTAALGIQPRCLPVVARSPAHD